MKSYGWDGTGLIPAHAGKTPGLTAPANPCSAHPRSRGENKHMRLCGSSTDGSSPLTRGKLGGPLKVRLHAGLIPAHAGKTGGATRAKAPRRAHPRSRGENRCGELCHRSAPGSSPLTRGKRYIPCGEVQSLRLIPAHAGKTPSHPHRHGDEPAHPRSRGENVFNNDVWNRLQGSSPLTRGKRGNELPHRLAPGLIPAHAGKTAGSRPRCLTREAHPRSRGENQPRAIRSMNHDGSSPLTRGKRVAQIRHWCDARLIPAHAGKT